MNMRRTSARAGLALVAVLMLNLAMAAFSQSSAVAAPPQQGANLLNSPGFEGAQGGQGTDTAWAAWHQEDNCKGDPNYNYACRPEWSLERNSALIRSGGQSQHIGVYYTPWHAGVMQTVNAPAGTTVRLTAWGRARAAQEQYPAPSDPTVNARMQVGIDPNGSGIWYQGVTWSGEINPHDTWQAVSVEATVGAAGKVTVYLSANYRGFSRTHLDAWWDDAVLEVVTLPTATPVPQPTSPPPPPAPVVTNTPLPTPTPEPTATPENTPTPSPTPEPTATATPSTGSICVTTFDDGNRNGIQDGIEGMISGVTITLFDGQEILGTQVSNALEGQICFNDLRPGPFQVFQTLPPSRQMTTVDNVSVDLQSGQMMVVLFGSVAAALPTELAAAPEAATPTIAPEPAQPDTSSDEPADSSLAETLLAVSGIVVLLVAAVLIGVFFVFRNK